MFLILESKIVIEKVYVDFSLKESDTSRSMM